MKIYFANSASQQADKIVAQLHKYKDGDVAMQMINSGYKYKVNYGVSGMILRQMAKKFELNNEVADRLWFREIRETMLLAILLADPDTLTIDQLNDWSNLLTENELAEYMGNYLLWQTSFLEELIKQWIADSDIRKQAAICIALSKKIQNDNKINQGVDIVFNFIKQQKVTQSIFLQRAISRFLRSYCRISPLSISSVKNLVNNFKALKINDLLVAELMIEIEYFEEQ